MSVVVFIFFKSVEFFKAVNPQLKAKDTIAGCNGEQPVYQYKIKGLLYDDSVGNVISSNPSYEIYNAGNVLMGSGNLSGGSYKIKPNSIGLINPSNYIVSYSDGQLTVKEKLILTEIGRASCRERV